jgi:hypothetical protein
MAYPKANLRLEKALWNFGICTHCRQLAPATYATHFDNHMRILRISKNEIQA